MVLQGLRELVLDVNAEVFGVPATVQIPSGPLVSTRVIWLEPTTEQRGSGDFQRAERRRICAIQRDSVATVPRGTIITIPDGGVNYRWQVDSMDGVFSDRHHVTVVSIAPAP